MKDWTNEMNEMNEVNKMNEMNAINDMNEWMDGWMSEWNEMKRSEMKWNEMKEIMNE